LHHPDQSRAGQAEVYPSFLPVGRHFIYSSCCSPTVNAIHVESLDENSQEQSARKLLSTNFQAAYVPASVSSPGRLLFMRERTLMAQTFDDRRAELIGEALPVAEHLGAYLDFAFFSVSANGVLVYRSGASQNLGQLTWLDLTGKHLGTVGEPSDYTSVALSPDGMRAAVSVADSEIWLMDLSRGIRTRFTFGQGRSISPIWSPHGTRIVFASDRDGGVFNLYQKVANGAADEQLLLKTPADKTPTSWSQDGRFLLYNAQNPKTGTGAWVLQLDGDGRKAAEPKPF